MAIKIWSWNNGDGSKLLAEAMGVKRLLHQGSRWRPRFRDYVINWGGTQLPNYLLDAQVINHPSNVARVTNKENFFKECNKDERNFNVPPFFFRRVDCEHYLNTTPNSAIVCRTLVSSHEGKGIVIADRVDQLVDARLYTAYVKKKAEYRIHVINGEVIDEVQKKKRRNLDGNQGDHRIRNTANGYVFARTDVVVPQCVRDAAVNAVAYFNLEFGAVDVIYNEHHDKAYVLEINTAPGIEGTTVQRYKEAFLKWLR